jgi:undecaprenyl-diphosphatase
VLEAFIASFLRSLTEFLAVSSSGHRILAREVFGVVTAPGIEGALRSGMVASILLVFRTDLWMMLRSVGHAALHPAGARASWATDVHLQTVFQLLVGSIPVALIGIPFGSSLIALGDDTKLVSTFVIISGLLLFLTRLFRRDVHRPLSGGIGFFIGCAQALAIIPGLARMAATISLGVYAGVAPVAAARFSILLALPALVGVLLVGTGDGVEWWTAGAPLSSLAAAFVGAGIAGWVGIHLMLRAMATGAVRYLALYCLLIGLLGIIFL